MNKNYNWDFDLTNKQDDNLIFLAEQGVDIIKNPDGTFKFEKPCWIENNHFYSKYDCEHTWGIDADGNRFHNCDICSHYLSNHCCEVQAKIANLGKSTYPMSTTVIKCEAYDPIEELNIIHNMSEMITFMNRTLNFLGGWDACCSFYGFEIPSDENGYVTSTIEEYYKNGGKFKNIPKEDEFPVVIYFDYHSTCYDALEWISIKSKSTGYWIVGGIDPCTNVVGNWKCSVCHGTSLKDSAFCPNCGAKME